MSQYVRKGFLNTNADIQEEKTTCIFKISRQYVFFFLFFHANRAKVYPLLKKNFLLLPSHRRRTRFTARVELFNGLAGVIF